MTCQLAVQDLMQSNQAACAEKLCQEHVHKQQLAWQLLPSNSVLTFHHKIHSRLT